jgi:TDG/mug DNA glycosylase family protein
VAGDLLRPGLSLVFCGYNPSLTSGDTGRHYAHRSNRFWKVLYEAGITPRLYAPEEDEGLLELGIGFTNLVSRPTRRADELRRDEILAGSAALRESLLVYQPRAVAYTGIGVYRLFLSAREVEWGLQPESAVPGVQDVVVPSPSGLNRMTFSKLVEHYRPLTRFVS